MVVRQALILHWNGSTWAQVKALSPDTFAILNAAGASSPGSAWAVGYLDTAATRQAMAFHCC